MGAAFYYYAYQSWMDTPQYIDVELAPDLNVGESGLLKLSLATEYHVRDGKVDWDSLGKGATMEVPFTVDNEAPVIEKVVVDVKNNVMKVTASDDQYLAGVVLYDVTGNRRLAYTGTTPAAITFEIPLTGVNGYKFVIQNADYAANFATYELRQTIGEPAPLPTRLAYDENFGDWATFGKQGYYWNTAEWFKTDLVPAAATAIGEYAMAVDAEANLYVIPVEDMTDHVLVRKLEYTLADMAYDHSTGTMHLLDNNGQELADPYDAYCQENFWIWDLAYSEYFSDSEPTSIGIRENGVVAPFSLMNPTFINYDMGRYGVSFLVGIASGGYEKITYKDWYGYDAEADSELFYDESADRYVSTSLGSFGKDVWPAVILDASSNAPEAQVAPQGTVRYNTVPEACWTPFPPVSLSTPQTTPSPSLSWQKTAPTVSLRSPTTPPSWSWWRSSPVL